MRKEYHKQNEGKERYAVYEESGYACHGKAERESDGQVICLDIISPVAERPDCYHHMWWDMRGGYCHEIHEDHSSYAGFQ